MTSDFTQGQDALQGATKPNKADGANPILLTIYIAEHCPNCRFAHEVAKFVQTTFPQVQVRLVDLQNVNEPIPEAVFATPTYLLNDRVWSLGNPSFQQVTTTLHQLLQP